jgi:hypothetical protein
MSGSKLSKDQMQKLALSGVGFIVLVYVYFSFFLGPLNTSRATMERTMAEVEAKLEASESDVQKARSLEQKASTATVEFAALKALSPEGAPIAWFPPRMRLFFADQGIDRVTARLEGNTPLTEPELDEWARYSWILDVPQTDFVTLGTALAQLENAEPLLTISRISIRAMAEDPQFQQISLTANTIVVKQ